MLRVSLPDVPGSLGRLASAIGEAGGDIEAIEIVEKRDGCAVDDVLLELSPERMPDSIVSACNALDGVEVLWISRYAAGGNLFMDLEVVEDLTSSPGDALDTVIDRIPMAYRVDWAARLRRGAGLDGAEIVRTAGGAPEELAWPSIDGPTRLPDDDVTVRCAAPMGPDVVVMGRRGGPEFLDSELARLAHLLELARTIARS
ncbi:MAG: ACT domain-containing protein [Nocardioides sp.]|uniref:ACT domain-containing protein n=1 Tax=Nocardioides sp. TaxID=35761 RepID=UPI003F021811